MALVFFEFGFKALKQGEGVSCGAGKAGQHLAMVQLAHFARRALDHYMAQGDLAIAPHGHLHALRRVAPHTQDGGAVERFQINPRTFFA